MDIRWPGSFSEEWQQAFYFFQMDSEDVDFISVGARDGRVIPIYKSVNLVETE